ncbi:MULTISPECIES: hypothetical protein [Streptomyces]|nr:hypothetical protein [Streptomyces kasugaensis]
MRGEPDAAAAAGRQTLGVRRPGDPQGPVIEGHRIVAELTGVAM